MSAHSRGREKPDFAKLHGLSVGQDRVPASAGTSGCVATGFRHRL